MSQFTPPFCALKLEERLRAALNEFLHHRSLDAILRRERSLADDGADEVVDVMNAAKKAARLVERLARFDRRVQPLVQVRIDLQGAAKEEARGVANALQRARTPPPPAAPEIRPGVLFPVRVGMISDEVSRKDAAHESELLLDAHPGGDLLAPTDEMIDTIGAAPLPDQPGHGNVAPEIGGCLLEIDAVDIGPHAAAAPASEMPSPCAPPVAPSTEECCGSCPVSCPSS
jgi:hypothetical protein